MKKLLMTLMTLLLCLCALPAMAEAALPDTALPEPMSWAYLATIAGSAAFAVVVAELTKMPLDRVWKIPTRLLVYGICLTTMLVANAFTCGLTLDSALLAAVNAVLAALTAYGLYEITLAKAEKPEHVPPDPVPFEDYDPDSHME